MNLLLRETHSAGELTRAQIEALARETLHARRNWSKAEVYGVEWRDVDGEGAARCMDAVVKDIRGCPFWYRLIHGRRVLRTEARALRLLGGSDGVPLLLAHPDVDMVVSERRAGVPARHFRRGEVPHLALEHLDAIVMRLHTGGTTHGDLHPSNVLIDGDTVTLIDWATAHFFGPEPRGALSYAFREWRDLDLRQIAKLKARHAPESLSPAERELLVRGGSGLSRSLRVLRHWRDVARGRKPLPPAVARENYRKRLNK